MIDLDLRAYFAAHAPVEIPGWFRPEIHLDTETPLCPVVDDIADPQLREQARQWELDGTYDIRDLHPVLARFQDEHEAYERGKYYAQQEYAERRYFEWRWFYADRMLESYAGRIQREA